MNDLKKLQLTRLTDKLDSLQVQAQLMQALKKALPGSELESWSNYISSMTPQIATFARKALIRCLSTNSNLYRWNRSATDSCPLCQTLETENHIMNNCSVAAQQGRYTWRHNAVLKRLAATIKNLLSANDRLFVDLPDYEDPGTIFDSIRTDITVIHNSGAIILESTCCYEKNRRIQITQIA